MLKQIILVPFAVLFAAQLAFAQTAEAPAQDATEEQAENTDIQINGQQTVAIVNGREIKFTDFYLMYLGLPAEERSNATFAEIFPPIVNALVNQALIIEVAKAESLDQDPNYLAQRDYNNDRLLSDFYLRALYANTISDEVLQQRYDEFLADFKANKGETEYSAEHIVVEDQELAKSLIERIKAGEDFGTLAKEASIDPSAQTNSGNIGYFAKGDMVEEFENAVINAGSNVLLDEPVKTQFGWHVIRVNDTRPIQIRSFEDAKEALTSLERQRIAEEATIKLRQDAQIQIFDTAGNLINAAPAEAAAEEPATE